MAITLAEAKVGMADKVDQMVVDEFRRDSFLLDRLVFDDAVSPGTGGSTMTYGYMQLKTPSTAARRDINTEYTNNEAKREKKTADLDIFGGSFKVVTMPPVAAQMMMKAVDFLLLVPYPSDLLYPYSGDTSTLQSTL